MHLSHEAGKVLYVINILLLLFGSSGVWFHKEMSTSFIKQSVVPQTLILKMAVIYIYLLVVADCRVSQGNLNILEQKTTVVSTKTCKICLLQWEDRTRNDPLHVKSQSLTHTEEILFTNEAV